MDSSPQPVRPPVPNPGDDPKSSDAMADEGDREGPVLTDGSRANESNEVETERDRDFARNGE